MRMLVELRREDEDPLRKLAVRDHRSLREQGGFLLHVKIQEELAMENGRPAPEAEPSAA